MNNRGDYIRGANFTVRGLPFRGLDRQLPSNPTPSRSPTHPDLSPQSHHLQDVNSQPRPPHHQRIPPVRYHPPSRSPAQHHLPSHSPAQQHLPSHSPAQHHLPSHSPAQQHLPSHSPAQHQPPRSRIPTRTVHKRRGLYYTWNRGGRVDELRIRFLARKYLELWKRQAFGRVMLSEARSHYRRQLMTRAWNDWYLYYWEKRKEWRLMLRAECHDRLRLWLKTFSAWKGFVLQARVKRARSEKARTHFHFTLRWKVWIEWRRVSAKLVQQRREVLAFRAEWLMRRSFSTWRAAFEERLDSRELEGKANSFQDLLMKRRTWRQWRLAMTDASHERMLRKKSDRFFADLLQRRSLRVLTAYVGQRRRKRTLRARSDRFKKISYTTWAFSVWLHRTRRSLAIRTFEDRIVELGRRCRMRRALMAFGKYVAGVREGQVRHATAVEFDERRVKRKALGRIREFRRLKRSRREMKETAEHLRSRMVLRRCLRHWSRRADLEVERRLQPLYRRAEEFHRTQLKRRVFHAWSRFVGQQRRDEARRGVADRIFASHALPRCFSRWKMFTARRRVVQSRRSLAVRFRRESLLLSALSRWRDRVEGLQEERYNLRVAVLHERETFLHRCLLKWRDRTRSVVWDAEKAAEAAAFDRSCLLRSCVRRWREATRLRLASNCSHRRAAEFRRRTLLYGTTCAWRLFAQRRAAKRRSWERAVAWHDLTRKCVVFQAWRTLTVERREAAAEAERRGGHHDLLLLRTTWRLFKVGIETSRSRRLETQRAEGHCRTVILHKIVASWRRFAVSRTSQRVQEQRAVQAARLRLQEGLARRVLAVWSRRRDERLLERLALTRAAVHHERRVLTRCVASWREWTAEQQRQRLRERQAAWFSRMRVLGTAWRTWRSRLEEAWEEREGRRQGLVIWAVQLQRRVWTAWRVWVVLQRMARQREVEAMLRYRRRILRTAVCHWFVCADHLRSVRTSASREENARHLQRSLESVRPFAIRWKEKTLGPGRRAALVKQKVVVPPTEVFDAAEWPQTTRPPPLIPDFLRVSIERDFLSPNCETESRSRQHYSIPEVDASVSKRPMETFHPSCPEPHPDRQRNLHPVPRDPLERPHPDPRDPLERPHPDSRDPLERPHPVPRDPFEDPHPDSLHDSQNGLGHSPTLLPPSFFAVEGDNGDDLGRVCVQLREVRETKNRIRTLRREMKRMRRNGWESDQLEREMEELTKKLEWLNPDALLDRAKQLLETTGHSF